jgi:AcrR family transcriptional regulator
LHAVPPEGGQALAPGEERDVVPGLERADGEQASENSTITDRAGANLAAVGYHFGSKTGLLAAVVRRVVEPINDAQSAALDRLLARNPEPAVGDLVEAFAGPFFDEMPADDEVGARTSRLIVRILGDPAEEMRTWTGPAEAAISDRYLAAFQRALPGLAPEELFFRVRGILAVAAVDRVEVYNRRVAGLSPVASAAARRWAITFLTAAMSAPPTGDAV